MATHSSLHAWKIPWMEEPAGVLQDTTEQFHFTSITFVCIYVYLCDVCVCVCVCVCVLFCTVTPDKILSFYFPE